MNRITTLLAAALVAGGSSLVLAQTSDHGKQTTGSDAHAGATAQQHDSSTGTPLPAANASRNAVGDGTKKNSENGASGSSTAEATPGRNSFTEGQAKSRIEGSGFQDVTGLKKDDDGIWTGQATKDGKPVTVQLDFQGDVLVKQ
jgi:hypothetical protein